MNSSLPRGPEFERALLGAAELDEPESRALARVAMALGAGGALLAPTTAVALGAAGSAAAKVGSAAGSVAGGSAAAGVGAAAPVLVTGTALWLKPLLVGSVLGTLVTSTVHVVHAPSAERKTLVPVASSVATDTTRARDARPVARRSVAARATIHEPLATPPADAPAPSPQAAPASEATSTGAVKPAPQPDIRSQNAVPDAFEPPASVDSVAAEVRAVDAARSALRSGDAARALRLLEAYERDWPSGVLAIEATVLSIEARFAVGDRVTAGRQARAFIGTHADSRYAARLRALIGIEIKKHEDRH